MGRPPLLPYECRSPAMPEVRAPYDPADANSLFMLYSGVSVGSFGGRTWFQPPFRFVDNVLMMPAVVCSSGVAVLPVWIPGMKMWRVKQQGDYKYSSFHPEPKYFKTVAAVINARLRAYERGGEEQPPFAFDPRRCRRHHSSLLDAEQIAAIGFAYDADARGRMTWRLADA